MSTTVKIYSYFEADVGGEIKSGGSRTVAKEVTAAADEVYEVRTVVADNYVDVVLWDSGDGGVDDFDFLWFESDVDVLLELIVDRAGSPSSSVIEVKAGVPFFMSSDDGENTTISGGSETTVDQIDRITCQRNVADGAGDATVRLVLMT